MTWWRLHRPTNRDYELVESLVELEAASTADDPVRAMRELVRFTEKMGASDRRIVWWSSWPYIGAAGAVYGWLCFIQSWWPVAVIIGVAHAWMMVGSGRTLERTKARMRANAAQLAEMRERLAYWEEQCGGD